MSETLPVTEPLRIVSLEAQNVKRLKAVHITPRGAVVGIGGRNAQGKSSVLDSIAMALSGDTCERPINDEASKAAIEIDCGEFRVRKHYTASGATLTITGKDGVKYPSPQTMLDKLIGDIAFDPLEFSRMKPAQQLETLRTLVGVNTSLLDQSHAKTFEERTVVNRKVRELESQLAGLGHYPEAPEEPVSAVEITERLKAATAKNAERADFIAEGRRLAAAEQQSSERIAALRVELGKLEALQASQANELNAMREKAAAMTECDVAAITDQLSSIEEINAKVRANTAHKVVTERLRQGREEADALTAKLEDIAKRKREKIAAAKYPVSGLQLGDDGVLFDGIPFAQASAAEKLRVSVAMGLAMNPRLRVILIRDGSLLDAESLAMIGQLAEDHQAQIWIERVGDGEECQVVIEDGHVKEARA